MARFYGSMINRRGNEVTAMGADDAHLRGWDAGVKVERFTNDTPERDQDVFVVSMTTGSHGSGRDVTLGRVVSTPDGPRWEPAREEK